MIFTKKMLVEDLDLPGGKNEVEDEIVDATRWSIVHNLIFRYENRFFRTDYSVGATEMQEEYPWDNYDMDEEVPCAEVKKVPKTIEVWEPVCSEKEEKTNEGN